MATENTLRTRQNMEVLDVWKNLHSQVNALTKKQIAVFPDTLKPKTQRDLEVEVNVDKTIESLNSLLEARLASLEFVLRNDQQLKGTIAVRPSVRVVVEPEVKADDEVPPLRPYAELSVAERRQAEREMRQRERLREQREARLVAEAEQRGRREAEQKSAQVSGEIQKGVKEIPFQSAYQEVINTGSVVSLWNNIVRFYQKQGLSRQSQEMVKVKVQDLIPNLEAIIYGLGEAIDVLFSNNTFNSSLGMKILEMMRPLSIYKLVKQQVDTSSFELISVSAMDTSFKNLFTELSQDRRELLAEVSKRGESGSRLATRPIRIIPEFSTKNFQERLKALMEEMGVKSLPQDIVQNLRKMNQTDFERYADQAIREVKSQHKPRLTSQESYLVRKAEELTFEIEAGRYQRDVTIPQDIERLAERAEALALPVEDAKYEAQKVDIPEGGIHPEDLNVDDFKDENGDVDLSRWGFAVAQWEAEEEEANRLDKEREDAIHHNQMIDDSQINDEVERRRLYDDIEREIRELQESVPHLDAMIEQMVEELEDIEVNSPLRKAEWADSVFEALREFLSRSGRQQKTKGKGKPVDSRGLAGLGRHYGADESESESEGSESESEEEDPLEFDDKRNEMYYSRPARRR